MSLSSLTEATGQPSSRAAATPQPSGGFLPPTGVLSQLAQTSKDRNVLLTVALVLRTLGPSGADAAHMIALGDAMRALRRAGFEAEARQHGVEALLPSWPRNDATEARR